MGAPTQGQNIIEVGFSIDKLSQEKQQVLSIVADLFAKLAEYDGKKFDPLGGGGLGQFRTSIQETGKAMGEYEKLAEKYNQTITDQVTKNQAAKKAADDLGNSLKDNSGAADTYTTSQERLRRKAAENKVAQEDVATSIRRVRDDYQNAIISQEEYTKRLNPLLAQQLALKVANTDVTKTLTVLEKQFQSTGGSTVQLENRLKELQGVYDKLSPEGRNADEGTALLKEIKDVDAAFKALKGDTGRFQDNVGNYSGAFQNAFKVLQEQLIAVKGQMGDIEKKAQDLTGRSPVGFDRNRFKGDVTNFVNTGTGNIGISAVEAATYQVASNKVQVLESNIERLGVGYKTTRQESRAFKEAAVEVGLALGQDAQEFLVFNEAVGHIQNGVNDIKAATKFQASDAKLITGLADAASTFAGAFGAAQAASALFAGDNKDLQEQMAKFQQLLVLINGLQAVANGLQAESGGIQLLLSARINLLNAAKSVQLLLTTKAIQTLEAEAVATEEAAIAKQQDAVATTELAVAEVTQTAAVAANTEATVANTVAQTGAKAATSGLSTAFIAGGIATLAIGAGVALALLTAKLIGYGNQALLTVEQQKDLATATKDVNDALEAQAKVFATLDSSTQRYYSNLIADAQAAGASQYEVLLAQQRFDKSQADAAQAEVDRLGATDAAYSRAGNAVQKLLNQQVEYAEIRKKLDAIPEKDQTSSQKRQLQAAKDNIDINKADLAVAQDNLDKMGKARKDRDDFTHKAQNEETQFNKLSLDDQLDVTEKAEDRKAELVKSRNASVLASETSTLHDRLSAIQSNLKQENDILDAQASKIKDNPANFVNGLLTPQAQAQVDQLNSQRAQNVIKTNDEILKQNRDFYKRQRDASLETYKTQQEDQIKAAQDIQQGKIPNTNALQPAPKVTISDQLTALAAEFQARRNILNAQRDRDLDDIGINGKESLQLLQDRQADIAKINAKYQSELTDANKKFIDDRQNLEIRALEESKKEWEKYYQERKNEIDANEADELALLNEMSEKKLINDRRYARDRQKIEDDAALARAQAAVRDAEVQKKYAKEGTNERAKAEEQLTARRKELSDQVKKSDDDTDKSRVSAIQNTLGDLTTAYNNTEGALSDLLDIGRKNDKTRLEEREIEQQKAFEEDQNRISTSTANEQTKSAQLLILDNNRQAQKEINDRKSRQLDNEKARFDKAASIANIILTTSQAVVKFLADPGGFAGLALSVSAGILGAAELAEAAAVQVPHYRMGAGIPGRPDHLGGAAMVGDNWQKELMIEPGGNAFWSPDRPTLMDVKPFTQIIPLDMITQMMMEGRFSNYDVAFGGRQDDGIAQEIAALKDTMIWQTRVMRETMKENRPHVTVVNKIGDDIAHQEWINRNVRN